MKIAQMLWWAIVPTLVLAGVTRTWTTDSGVKLEAEYVAMREGSVVLRTAQGKHVELPLSRLSRADREYVQSLGAAGSTPDAEGGGAAEPSVTSGFVGRVEFETRSGRVAGGMGFLVRMEGEPAPLLLTVQRLFGPEGGLAREVKRAEMAQFVKSLAWNDLMGGTTVVTRAEVLPLGMSKLDVAVFRTGLPEAYPGTLARASPRAGEVVWLVALLWGQPTNQVLHRAVVTETGPDWFKCQFDRGRLVLRGALGAPYINRSGEIVGLHIGTFTSPGRVAGSAIGAESLQRDLRKALPPRRGGVRL